MNFNVTHCGFNYKNCYKTFEIKNERYYFDPKIISNLNN